MANNWQLDLVGSLDGTQSRNQLNSDIKKLEGNLNKLKLYAEIDKNQVTQLQHQLKNLQVQLNNVTVSDAVINGLVAKINTGLQNVNIGNINVGNVNAQAQQAGQQLGQQISQGVAQGINNNERILNSFRDSLNRINRSASNINIGITNGNSGSQQITHIINDIESLNLRLTSLNESMSNINGRRGTRNALTVKISGIDELGQAVTLTRQYDAATGNLIRNINAVSTATQKANSQLETMAANQIKKQQILRNQVSQIYNSAIDPNADRSITDTGNLSRLEERYQAIQNAINGMGSTSKTVFAEQEANITRMISELKNYVREYRNAENVRASLKPDKLAEGISKAQSRWKSLETQINNANLNFNDSGLQKLNQQIENIRANIRTIETGGILNKSEIERLHTTLTNAKHELDALVRMKTSNSSLEAIRLQAETLKNNLNEFSKKNTGFADWTRAVNGTTVSVETLKRELDSVKTASDLKLAIAKVNEFKSAFKEANVTIKGTNVDKLNADVQKLASNLNTFASNNEGFSTFKTNIKGVEISLDSLMQKLSTVNNNTDLSTIRSQANALKSAFVELQQVNKIQLSMSTGGYESKVDSLIGKTQQWVDANGNARISTDALQTAMNNLNTAYANITATGGNTVANQQALIQAEKALDVEVKKVQSSVTSMNATMAKSSAVDALRQKVQMFYDTNTKSHRTYGAQLQNIMAQLASGSEVPIAKLRQLSQEFINVQNSARQAGKLGLSFFDTLKQGMAKFSYWTSSTFLVMKTITEIKQAVSTVKALDTALVDLRKTTTMTAKELEDFYYVSNDVAKQMGVATEEILTQASAWSRLGFSSKEAATEMAKLSSQFKLISPGMTSDEAVSGLVSVMKAYKIEVDDVLDGIMSKVNVVGNKFALSNSNIINMLQDSVSAMAEGNNTLEETIALETAAYEITQSENVGVGFKTVALRLRGLNEETQELDDSLKTISGDLYDLTGVSVMQDADTYKSTYQILKEISNVWGELSDKKQAEALELMFGKHRANIGSAVLSNFEAAERAMEEMVNSAGNANAELNIAMDSIEYKANKLKETGTGIAQNLFKREDMKTVLDTLTSFMEMLDKVTEKVGLFGSIGLGVGLFAGIKNVGKRRSTMFHNCFEYADRDRCFLYEIGFLSPIVEYTLVNEATISVEII